MTAPGRSGRLLQGADPVALGPPAAEGGALGPPAERETVGLPSARRGAVGPPAAARPVDAGRVAGAMRGSVRLLGRGIGYSASPAMQNAAFAALGLPVIYELADVPPEAVPGELARFRSGDGIGANVTTPHKVLVASLVDELRGDAARLGAVNTVVVERGRIIGHNTDLPAIVDELRDLLDGTPRHAVVLGDGGASGAVLEALGRIGAERVSRVTRQGPGPTFRDLPAMLLDADLLVNATPVGTGDDATLVPGALLRADLAVFDLIYRPSPTRLVRDARAVGARARGGAGVLLGQGSRSFELWVGVTAPLEVMRDALRRELDDPDV